MPTQAAVVQYALDLPVLLVGLHMLGAVLLVAALSLIEGDASLTQQQFTLVGMNLREQLGLSADPGVLDAQRQLEGVPHYFVQSLQFPYLAGLRFVFPPYQVGPYSDGTQTVEVPAAVLLPHVAPTYRGLFQGVAPAATG